ncbi:agmatinase [Methanogenium organophilum]|uniref:Agmatinase n=1 Tax=Methanogenium organophilum TaxID=2199 RepID=A0A9X9S3Y1_METOG|nr:agmatinase [Methanogenium organophilum]WAI01050.1 agmatinase [Methanogenium organophilum]
MQYFNNNLFADADTPYQDARYVIFGVPFDGTTSFMAGTRDGPDAIRKVSYNFEQFLPEFGYTLSEAGIHDLGNLEVASVPEDVISAVEEITCQIRKDGKIPIVLGGEHSITLGSYRAFSSECFVVCDAHLDLREEFGNTPYNHACITRRVNEAGAKETFIIGARSGTEEEYEFAKNLNLYSADCVRERGITDILDEISRKIAGRSVYLSIDADAIDCCLTPGLGTPEPFGITHFDVRDVIRRIGPLAEAFDYMEVCPIDAGQTAAVAAKLIREFIAAHQIKNEK